MHSEVLKSEGKTPLEDLGIERRISVKLILQKYNGRVWTRFVCLKTGTICGLL
jgi:hypothetical protein